jgi:hypothetical protein
MAELNLSAEDRQELSRIVGEALIEDGTAQVAGASVELAATDFDPKQFFCQNWPAIKSVLQFLPLPAIAVRVIVAAGDFLHGRICR